MKKLLFTIILVFVALSYFSVAMAQLKTGSGISYYKYGTGPDIIVYMHGYGENPLSSAFYKSFYPSIQDKVTCYMGLIPGTSGWEKPWNGVSIGEDFLKFVVSENPGKRIFIATFSAGADPDYLYNVKGITAFASVAGKADNYKGFMAWVPEAPPVYAFAGTNDTSQNSFALCSKTWTSWFVGAGGGSKLIWKPITGANHGGVAAYAYNPTNGLWEWFDSIGKQPDPINPVTKIPVKNAYFILPDKKLEVELENGEVLRFTPD